MHEKLLNYPILYLSRYINVNKGIYYRYLQALRDVNNAESWENYILFILEGIVRTAQSTSETVIALRERMNDYKHRIREKHPSIYSQDLLNTLFSYPYTRIKILQDRLNVSYLTARKYLDVLTEDKLLEKIRIGRDNLYVNTSMMEILTVNAENTLKVKS